MAASPALVSIGIPVYNEARFLASALDSLLAQDYPAIEFILCDNASTDDTLTIAERYAQEDPRLRIQRAANNLGAAANFQRAFDLATGRYFMWAAGHDLWSRDYVSQCVRQLESRPEAVIAVGRSRWIGPEGEDLGRPVSNYDTRGMAEVGRFFAVLMGNMHPIYGVIRREALGRAMPMPEMVGADLHILSRLAWAGPTLLAPEGLWSRRDIHPPERYADKLARYRSARYGLVRGRLSRSLPFARLVGSLLAQVATRPRGLMRRVLLIALIPGIMALRYLDRD